MSVMKKLRGYLEEHQVKYETFQHPQTFTAQDTAAYQHIPGKRMAKVVMVKRDAYPIMTVIPASHRIDFERLQNNLGGKVELETEKEFADLFPGCEVGAEPPFGNLFNLEVWVDTELSKNEEIIFNGGTHKETVSIRYEEFVKLVNPMVGSFSKHLS